MADLRSVGESVLGAVASPWLATTSRWQRRLRVLAYHEISDAAAFASQMAFLIENFQPVTIEEAISPSLYARHRRPVWITFDDGDPSIVVAGLPVLVDLSIPATIFICPGLVDTDEPFWWQVVQAAVDAGLEPDYPVGHLKSMEDSRRRGFIADLRQRVQELTGHPPRQPQLTPEQIGLWLDEGHSIGNHTWDHPMLDQCDAEEQARQIEAADAWIQQRFSPTHRVFAYPNGNSTPRSKAVLTDLGYEMALLFDHRISNLDDRFAVSRIRVNADDSLDEFKARVSGLHPWVHHALRRS